MKFKEEKGLIYFTFQRGSSERMIGVWIDGPGKDGIIQTDTDISFPGTRAKQAIVVDIMNGTEQELDFKQSGSNTVLEGMLIKDYPVFVKVNS